MWRASNHQGLRLRPAAWLVWVLASTPVVAGDSPWYVAVQAGDARIDADLGATPNQRFDDEAGARGLGVGYRLSPRLAVELGLHDLGSYSGFGRICADGDPNCVERLVLSTGDGLGLCARPDPECLGPTFSRLETDLEATSLSLLPRWPVHRRLALFGRAGIVDWKGDVAVLSLARSDRLSGRDLLLGAGVEVALSDAFALAVEYQRFDLDYRATTAGVHWRF